MRKYCNCNAHLLDVFYPFIFLSRYSDADIPVYFLKAIENKDKYQEEGKFIAWIKVVAQNMAKDMFKSAYFQNSCLSSNIDDFQLEDKKQTALEVQLQKERQKTILKAVDSLPSKMRDVIYFYEFEELSYEETAKKLGISIGTVKSRLFNAREILSQKLSHLKGE